MQDQRISRQLVFAYKRKGGRLVADPKAAAVVRRLYARAAGHGGDA
jgi:hypothetical protein